MVYSNDVTERFATRAFIFAWAVVFCIMQMVCTYIKTINMQNQLNESEAVIEGYREELTEYQSLLDTEIDKNAQLSDTITGLQSQLSDISNELAATQDKLATVEGEKSAFEEQHKDCRPPIGYSKDNVLAASYVTGDELSNGLLYNLKDYAECFVEMEEEYGINAIFLASVAALESGWGRNENATYKNNIYGYKNSNGDGFRTFSSKEECIQHVAKYLKSSYLTEGGKYYNGVSIEAVNIKYCEQSWWAEKVNHVAEGIVSRINNT